MGLLNVKTLPCPFCGGGVKLETNVKNTTTISGYTATLHCQCCYCEMDNSEFIVLMRKKETNDEWMQRKSVLMSDAVDHLIDCWNKRH